MPVEELRRLLDDAGVRYETIRHLTSYTSQRTAEVAHVPGQELAKAVILKVDGGFAMAVLPAPAHIDLDAFRAAAGAGSVTLAREGEFAKLFPHCETGAEPPFGELYGLPVWVDEELTRDQRIAFNAGSHTEALRMEYKDWARLVRPKVARFAHH